MIRIPFDSYCLWAAICEAEALVGAKLQKVTQIGHAAVALDLYLRAETRLLLSWDARFARLHMVAKRADSISPPSGFVTELRRHIGGARLTKMEQVGFDRIAKLEFSRGDDVWTLIAELMGKHSNLMLLDAHRRVVAAAKWVGPKLSRRQILPQRTYEPPPFPPRPPLTTASPDSITSIEALTTFEGASPFLTHLLASRGLPDSFAAWQKRIRSKSIETVFAPGSGVYPEPLEAIGLAGHARPSFSFAYEQHVDALIESTGIEQRRSQLRSQLQRLIDARSVAISQLRQAEDAAKDAGMWQLFGELILAYSYQIQPEQREFRSLDYEGSPVTIPLREDQSALENAHRYFEKAKRAKAAAPHVHEQLMRLTAEHDDAERMLAQLETASPAELDLLWNAGDRQGWLHRQEPVAREKHERPYAGHSIREWTAPGGWLVLVGESATANDYLVSRIAKPNDLWFHVRGATSSHVVIATRNQPDKVQSDAIRFAADLCVRHSPSKHSGYVAVDYTLKKYVRKPRGSPPGTVVYEREKTLHIER